MREAFLILGCSKVALSFSGSKANGASMLQQCARNAERKRKKVAKWEACASMPRTAGERGGGRRNIVHAQRCTVRARATRLAHGSVQRGSRAHSYSISSV